MFRCWGSSAVAVTPVVPTNHMVTQPSTTTPVGAPSSSSGSARRYAWKASEANTQAVADSALSTPPSSSSSPVLPIANRPRVYSSFKGLPITLIKLIVNHLSFKDYVKSKHIIHLMNSTLDSKTYVKLQGESFHRIACYVNGIYEFTHYKIAFENFAKKKTFKIIPLLKNFRINILTDYLKEKGKEDSRYTQKLHWLLWKLQRLRWDLQGLIDIYPQMKNIEKALDQFIKSIKVVKRTDLSLFYEKYRFRSLDLFYNSFSTFLENCTWDPLSVRVTINYLDFFFGNFGRMRELLIDSITKQCVKENLTEHWSDFISALLETGKWEYSLGKYICDRVFSNLEKLKNVSEEGFEISNERLRDLFNPYTEDLELCYQRPYTDEDLNFIRNRCPKLIRVSLRSPSFSPEAIKRFFNHPSSSSIQYLEAWYETVYLSDILPLLKFQSRYLKISTLKIKATDLSILQNWNYGKTNLPYSKDAPDIDNNIICERIVIENVGNDKETVVNFSDKMKKWVYYLKAIGLLTKTHVDTVVQAQNGNRTVIFFKVANQIQFSDSQ